MLLTPHLLRVADTHGQRAWRMRLVAGRTLAPHLAAFRRHADAVVPNEWHAADVSRLAGELVHGPIDKGCHTRWDRAFRRAPFVDPSPDVRPESDAQLAAVFDWVRRMDLVTQRVEYGAHEAMLGEWAAWWPAVARRADRARYPADYPDAPPRVVGLEFRGTAWLLVRDVFDGLGRPDHLLTQIMADALEEAGLPTPLCEVYRWEPDGLTEADWLFAASSLTHSWCDNVQQGAKGGRRRSDRPIDDDWPVLPVRVHWPMDR